MGVPDVLHLRTHTPNEIKINEEAERPCATKKYNDTFLTLIFNGCKPAKPPFGRKKDEKKKRSAR